MHFFIFAEVGMFVRGKRFDVCGTCVALFAICMIFIGITWAPLAVYLEWDPVFLVLNNHFPRIFEHKWSAIIVLLIRYCLTQWCVLEGSRLYILVLIHIMIIGNSYVVIVLHIQKYSLGNKVTDLYSMLHCTNQIGQDTFTTLIGLLMSCGMI